MAQIARAELEPLRIGALMVLTGQYAMQGAAFREGLEIAIDEVNARGGISGRRLELRAEDTANLPVQALTAARKLIATDRVVAAVTTSYPELATGAAEFQKQHIPVVHLWDASPDIEAMGEYIFGIGPWTPSAGEASALFARVTLGAKTAVTFHINDPWSQLVTEYFKKEFEKQGGRIIQSFAYNPQDQDFRAAFTKIRPLKPEVIYAPITDNIVPFYTQLKQANVGSPIISSDVIADEHVRQAPSAFEGIYLSQMKDPSGPGMTKLAAAYERKFHRAVALPWFTATAYDGLNLIAHCIEKAGAGSAAIRDCIATVKSLPAVTRTFVFNAGGSSPQIESIFRIESGKFVHQEP